MKEWLVINTDGEILRTIVTGNSAGSKIAFQKLKTKYPDTYMFLKLVENKKPRRSTKHGIGCDVELGSIRDAATLSKYGTLLIVGGAAFYFFWKYGSFKFFKNFGKNVKTIAKAPGEFSVAEGDVIENTVFQIDKLMGMIKDRVGESAQYKTFATEWNTLRNQTKGAEKMRVGFSEFYIKDKTKKEEMANKLSAFRARILKYLKSIN